MWILYGQRYARLNESTVYCWSHSVILLRRSAFPAPARALPVIHPMVQSVVHASSRVLMDPVNAAPGKLHAVRIAVMRASYVAERSAVLRERSVRTGLAYPALPAKLLAGRPVAPRG
jgi:hypothetical protein